MSATTIIVNDVEPRRQYTATSGQTVFDFPIPFFEDVDLQVYLTPAGQQSSDTADILTLTTDYSVAGANTQDSGAITLVTGASTGDIITIERVVSIARTADYQTSGDLLAETVNREQDTEIFISQQLRADINRSFRFPITDSSGASLVLPSPTANYVIGWNSDGDSITNFQEIGQYQGTDATATTISYSVRDLVKSTTAGQLNNVYICTQASPSGTLLTNTSYWSLIVDAVSAGTSESNAAASASAAATSATNSATSASNAAASESTAANSATSSANSATSAATSATNAETAYDNFDDRYLGAKASDPSVDNDGGALITGALYFNTTDDVMKVWEGSSWIAAYASLSGALIASNNLSDLNSASAARTNLGLGTAATTASTDYATAAQGTLADSALQDIVDDTTPQLGGDLDTNGNSVDFGAAGWSIALSGSDLVFSYNGTAKIKFASDGEIVTVDDVTAFGTV